MSMRFSFISPRSSLPLLAILMGSVFTVGISVSAGAATNAGAWVTTKVDKAALPYCAVSRKIDNVAVTVGRTTKGQSSLALEFGADELDPKKVYKVELRPGNANKIEMESRPINARTFVFNFDTVVDLDAAFDEKPALMMRYDNVSSTFSIGGWDQAGKDLSACLSALMPTAAPVKTASAPVALSDKGQKDIKNETAFAAGRSPEKPVSVEPLPPREVPLSLPAGKAAVAASVPMTAGTGNALAQAQEELRQAKDNLNMVQADRINNPVPKGADAEKKKVSSDVKSAALEADKKALMNELSAKQVADQQKGMAVIDTLKVQIKSLEDKNKKLESDLVATKGKAAAEVAAAAQETAAARNSELTLKSQEIEKLKGDLAKLQNDRAALQGEYNALQDQAAKGASMGKELAALQTRLQTMEEEKATLKEQLLSAMDKPKEPGVDDLRRRLEVLTEENVKLRADLAASKDSGDVKISVAAERPLRVQLRDLQAENSALRARETELTNLMEGRQKNIEKDMLAGIKGDNGMEQAIRRYQEAEREVQRLSLTLRAERSKCAADKKEIEYMLFDPKIANDGQIALLNSLEDQIATLKADHKKGTEGTTVACVPPGNVDAAPLAVTPTKSEPPKDKVAFIDVDKNISSAKTDDKIDDKSVAVTVSPKPALLLAAQVKSESKPTPLKMAGTKVIEETAKQPVPLSAETLLFAGKENENTSQIANGAVPAPVTAPLQTLPGTPSLPVPAAAQNAAADQLPTTRAVMPAPTGVLSIPAMTNQAPIVAQSADMEGERLTALLKQAGVAIAAPIARAQQNPFGAQVAYRWETDVLAGLFVNRASVPVKDFDGVVSGEIQKLKSKCKGDFAATNAAEQKSSALSYVSYDAACISGANSTSAALLFYQDGKGMHIISHEAAPDDMGAAMDARDRLADAIKETK